MINESPNSPSKDPTDLLYEQVQRLSEIHQAQQVQISLLSDQNERLIAALKTLAAEREPSSSRHVKIEDINMPFVALVGFMVKIAFASIPAAILIGLFYFVVVVIFGGLLAGLLAGILGSL